MSWCKYRPHNFSTYLLSRSFFSVYPTNSENDATAYAYSRELRRLFREGSQGKFPTAYVNYATGDETLEMLYGYETRRLDKLKALKKEHDPENRFRFYAPIRLE